MTIITTCSNIYVRIYQFYIYRIIFCLYAGYGSTYKSQEKQFIRQMKYVVIVALLLWNIIATSTYYYFYCH
ncbi:hypothetical protein BJ944DRAFT_267604 [Cunninghamella echinulata]|nr:hypothetical protein BJ944DRAFT_267604 [Cunninghamella echinulata]